MVQEKVFCCLELGKLSKAAARIEVGMFLAHKLLLILAILGLAVLANLLFLNYKIFTQKNEKPERVSEIAETPAIFPLESEATPSGSTDIQALIDSKIAKLREELKKSYPRPTDEL